MKDTMQLTSDQPIPVRVQPACSAEALRKERQLGYSKGYGAALKRLDDLKAEIAKLREVKTLPPMDEHDTTLQYLINTAEAMVKAAALLIEARTGTNPPNEKAH